MLNPVRVTHSPQSPATWITDPLFQVRTRIMARHISVASNSATPPDCLDTNGAAAFLGMSERSLRQYRVDRKGPRHLTLDGWRVIYHRADLVIYLRQQVERAEREAETYRARFAQLTAESSPSPSRP